MVQELFIRVLRLNRGLPSSKRFPYIQLVLVLLSLFINVPALHSFSFHLPHRTIVYIQLLLIRASLLPLFSKSVCLPTLFVLHQKAFLRLLGRAFSFTLPLLSETICHWKPPAPDVWAESMKLTQETYKQTKQIIFPHQSIQDNLRFDHSSCRIKI